MTQLKTRLARLERQSSADDDGPRVEVWIPDNGRGPDGPLEPGEERQHKSGHAAVVIYGADQLAAGNQTAGV